MISPAEVVFGALCVVSLVARLHVGKKRRQPPILKHLRHRFELVERWRLGRPGPECPTNGRQESKWPNPERNSRDGRPSHLEIARHALSIGCVVNEAHALVLHLLHEPHRQPREHSSAAPFRQRRRIDRPNGSHAPVSAAPGPAEEYAHSHKPPLRFGDQAGRNPEGIPFMLPSPEFDGARDCRAARNSCR